MGQSQTHTGQNSSLQHIDDSMRLAKILNEKEYMFAAIRADVNEVVETKNETTMKILEEELNKHINELRTLKHQSIKCSRIDKLIYNYELILAKLKSVFNIGSAKDMVAVDKLHLSDQEFDDMVEAFAEINNENELQEIAGCKLNSVPDELQQRNTIFYDAPEPNEFDQTSESVSQNNSNFNSVDYRYRDVAKLTDEDIDSQLRMLSLEKFHSFKRSSSFEEFTRTPTNLDPEVYKYPNSNTNSAQFNETASENQMPVEENNEDPDEENIEKRFIELQILFDSCCIEKDYKDLEDKVFSYVNLLHTSKDQDRKIWLKHTVELLEKIKATRRSLFHPASNKSSRSSSSAGISNDRQLDVSYASNELDGDVYSNVEIIRKHTKVVKNGDVEETQETIQTFVRPETVYSNMDIIREHRESIEQRQKNSFGNICKPPVPNPRRHEDKLMRDLAKYWEDICEIDEKSTANFDDIKTVEEIQKYLEVAQNIFHRKINDIKGKFAEEYPEDVVNI